MAKKKLILNESVTRRFMKLASVKPAYVSNFLREAEDMMEPEEEEDEGMEAEPEMEMAPEEAPEMDPEMDAEMGMEDEAAPDQSEAAESMIMDLMAKIQEFATEQGVSVSVEGDEAAAEGEEEMDMDAEMAPDAELEGGDPELSDEEPEAEMEMDDAEEIVQEVTRRVARRLLKIAKSKR
jgi:hypothetical protein